MLEEVDVEVDGAVEDGEHVREVGDLLHPLGPVQLEPLVAQAVVHLQGNQSHVLSQLMDILGFQRVISTPLTS